MFSRHQLTNQLIINIWLLLTELFFGIKKLQLPLVFGPYQIFMGGAIFECWLPTYWHITLCTFTEKVPSVNKTGVVSGWAEIETTYSAHRCHCSGVAELLTPLHLCSTLQNNLWPHTAMMLTAGWGMASVRRLYWPPSCGSLLTKDILNSTSTRMREEEPTYPNKCRHGSVPVCTHAHVYTQPHIHRWDFGALAHCSMATRLIWRNTFSIT